jgi:hypothetical protein
MQASNKTEEKIITAISDCKAYNSRGSLFSPPPVKWLTCMFCCQQLKQRVLHRIFCSD